MFFYNYDFFYSLSLSEKIDSPITEDNKFFNITKLNIIENFVRLQLLINELVKFREFR